MGVSYNKLWKLLIDKNMNKTELRLKAKISSSTIAKMGRNESVSLETINKICTYLHCNIGDIVDINSDE